MKNIWYSLIVIALASCKRETPAEQPQGAATTGAATTITLSETQAQHIGIETAVLQSRQIAGVINATGVLDVPPQNMVDVAAPYGGFVKNTTMLQGMKVRKGDVLVELQHQDYIQLQQDYINSASQLEYLEKEYSRQQTLAAENVNAQKTWQQSKAQVEGMRATVQGLKAKLALLNITPDLLQQKGIQSSVFLYAPVNGYITEVNINLGKYVSPADVMLKIVNTEHLHAELQVFEKDIVKVKPGQHIRFHLPNESREREAEVYLVGREISPERTVRVHGHLHQEDPQLLPGMFINATIDTDKETASVLPEEAVVTHEGKTYVFRALPQPRQYALVQVTTGGSQGGMVTIQPAETLTAETPIVVKGAYTLLSMMFNAGEEE